MSETTTPTPNQVAEMSSRHSDVSPEGTNTPPPLAEEKPQVEAVSNNTPDRGETGDKQDVFPRDYVEKLREENAKFRTRAKAADELAQRLQVTLVQADGRLQDPTDLPFDFELVNDPEKLASAISDLIEAKPHLRARRVQGDIGQGTRGSASESQSLIDLIRG